MHVGPQNLLYCVRQEFWPLNGRNICRMIVYKCVNCFKTKPLTSQQIMGDLPRDRITVQPAFYCTGLDFCGPFWIKYRGQRKGVYHKVYVCIFICLSTKAIHLELVCDLTSNAFIASLKRFFARRGKAKTLYSDNGTNFVGAGNELGRLYKIVQDRDENLDRYTSSENITWKFLPPKSPNFGGLWEAGVKSFKYHLKRVVGEAKLNYEEFLTIVIQIEGMLNSRPLTPLSADMDDLEVLTPGHFLIGRPITSIAEPSLLEVNDNRLKIWQKLTKMVQTIWKKWRHSYLNNLQQRNKWLVTKKNVKNGDMVLVKEDNLPVNTWLMGRITEVFPGSDGLVRVVLVKTKKGNFKRPISKICLLPFES